MKSRKKTILKYLISEFVRTGSPVSSLDIKKRYSMECSPATIRNEMAELEEDGFLLRFHNFGGRIPSDTGYRYFVDFLLEDTPLEKDDELSINSIEEIGRLKRVKELIAKELFQYSAGLLSSLTGQAGFLVDGRSELKIIRNISIVKVNENVFTVFFQFEDNVIRSKIWFSRSKIDIREIERINNILAVLIKLRSTAENMVNQFFSSNPELNFLRENIYDILDLVINSDLESNIDRNLYIEGMRQLILKPEFEDVGKMRMLVELFENRSVLVNEIKRLTAGNDLKIRIGEEFDIENLKEFSFVAVPFGVDGINRGMLGIIGSKRMEYQKIIKIVKKTSENISNILSKLKLER